MAHSTNFTNWQVISSERTSQQPPRILPVTGSDRPKWSVMIPVFNAGAFLKETLKSVLIQALPEREMQIEVVDDCSTDIDVQALVKEIGHGRVNYYRQPYNVGNLRNFETCLNLSQGHYIHILHSDDLVLPGYYEQLDSLFNAYPAIGAAFCRYQYIDENGSTILYQDAEAPEACVLENWLLRLAEHKRIEYVNIAVKREVYEKLGGFYGVHYAEDWEMWARIATQYSFAYTPEILASYRRHPASMAGRSSLTGQNLKDLEFVMARINTYLPPSHKKKILRESKRFYAHFAVRTAHALWSNFRNSKGAIAQLRKGWSMHKDMVIFFSIFKMFRKMLMDR